VIQFLGGSGAGRSNVGTDRFRRMNNPNASVKCERELISHVTNCRSFCLLSFNRRIESEPAVIMFTLDTTPKSAHNIWITFQRNKISMLVGFARRMVFIFHEESSQALVLCSIYLFILEQSNMLYSFRDSVKCPLLLQMLVAGKNAQAPCLRWWQTYCKLKHLPWLSANYFFRPTKSILTLSKFRCI
jgi:hypothetical protein